MIEFTIKHRLLVVAQYTAVHRDKGPIRALQDLRPKIKLLHSGEDDLVSSARQGGEEEEERRGDPFTDTGLQNVGHKAHEDVYVCVRVCHGGEK